MRSAASCERCSGPALDPRRLSTTTPTVCASCVLRQRRISGCIPIHVSTPDTNGPSSAHRVGSGLETVAHTSSASVDEVWSGLSQRIGPLTLGGSLGQSRTTDDQLTSYAATVQFAATDSLRVAVERRLGFAAFSPRTVSLGLTRLAHRAEIVWTPAARFHLAVAGSYDQLSDANTRWELSVSPRAALARTQRLNLDVGAQFYQFRVAKDLDHGYYDPARYEFYSAVLAPYWKVSENLGVSFAAGIGPQRDSSSSSYTLGMNTSARSDIRYLSGVGAESAGRRHQQPPRRQRGFPGHERRSCAAAAILNLGLHSSVFGRGEHHARVDYRRGGLHRLPPG